MARVADIAKKMERLAPLSLVEEWDNVGLQVGREDAEIESVMLALDVTDSVLDSAIKHGCGMIIAHHPLFFRDIKAVTERTSAGAVALRAAESRVAVYIAHTNLDNARAGINDYLASALGLNDVEVLHMKSRLKKLVVFVPEGSVEDVRAALGEAGAGLIGLYSHCSFAAPGVGSFRPMAQARPAIGETGKQSTAEEYRLEVEVAETELDAAVSAMIAVHPYEEVVYDVYQLLKMDGQHGLGRIGNLKEAVNFDSFIDECVALFGPMVRSAGPARAVGRVAVCGGSGAALIDRAAGGGADVLVTGDVKYHDAARAIELGLAIVDAGHDRTELVALERLRADLEGDFGLPVIMSEQLDSIWRGAR